MDIRIVRNAAGQLEKMLRLAKSALSQIQAEVFDSDLLETSRYVYPRLALESFLQELHDVLLVVLEAAEMPGTRASLVKSWTRFTSSKGGGLCQTIDNGEFQHSRSPALSFVERMCKACEWLRSKEFQAGKPGSLADLRGCCAMRQRWSIAGMPPQQTRRSFRPSCTTISAPASLTLD